MLQIENMLLDIFCLVFRYYLVVNYINFSSTLHLLHKHKMDKLSRFKYVFSIFGVGLCEHTPCK